ncbi:MAG: enoyl-CoA hydratase/isomerase family protein [Planctomycetes bacterium]|nr:enoyl-CoA hydratase/isomerase family protein [Planctomycetota bacterium]
MVPTAPVAVEQHDRIAVVRLQHGKVNALDVELAAALTAAVAAAESSTTADALVITGQGRAFSAGVDLVRYVREGADYADALLTAIDVMFVQVFRCRLPTVAAVNGHALAGGHVLACACDLRVMAEGQGKVGVPELAAGVPFPWLALELVRHTTPAHQLAELVALGETFPAAAAHARNLVHALVPAAQLLPQAIALARRLAGNGGPAFALQREQLREPILRDPARAVHDQRVRAIWRAPETRQRVERYLAHLAARS